MFFTVIVHANTSPGFTAVPSPDTPFTVTDFDTSDFGVNGLFVEQSTLQVVVPFGVTVLSIVGIAGGPFNTDCAATVPE